MIKVGYQGIEGSNAEQAAKDIVALLDMNNVIYVPLVDSGGVVKALQSGDIDYGVCAVYNSVAGIVKETVNATDGVDFEILGESTLNIHHCMFKKNNTVKDEDLKYVASHILALKQCEKHLQDLYPQLETVISEDTGLAAKQLADGTLSEDYTVLCRKNAGELFGLTLMNENIEDFENNRTHFILFKLK